VRIAPAAIAAAYREACLAELDAPKPGNVHKYAVGHQMTVADFVRAAEASAGAIAQSGARVGARIRAAVAATQAAVGVNATLGIILLCAPLAAAAEAPGDDLRARLVAVLGVLDATDAADAFAAIAAARPGGLGRAARNDVNEPADTTLLRAMAEAADRDSIARQYATGFDDVFALGMPVLAATRRRHAEPRWATLAVYLTYLSAFPDTHIVRKFNAAAADAVREEARDWRLRFDASSDPTGLLAELLGWDTALKARGLNPGASADLTVATLFADSLSQLVPGRLALKPQQ
jgi:triphosphoribosyl-dephospho-CoA synthase